MIYLKSQGSDDVEDVDEASRLESYRQVTEEDVEEPVLVFRVTSQVEMVQCEHEVNDDGQNDC